MVHKGALQQVRPGEGERLDSACSFQLSLGKEAPTPLMLMKTGD